MRGKVVLGLKSWWPENRSCRNTKAGKASAVELTPEVIDGRLGGLLAESSLSEQSSEPRQAQLLWEGKLHGVFNSQTTFPIDPSSTRRTLFPWKGFISVSCGGLGSLDQDRLCAETTK